MGYRGIDHHCDDDRNVAIFLTATEAHKEAERLFLISVSAIDWETEV